MPQKYIIDVDTGVDDAQALMLALSRADVEVLAITCVAGNCSLDQVCVNTLKVLSVCNKLHVPVYRGSGLPLVGSRLEATHYHGQDGLGDASMDISVDTDVIQPHSAVTALLELVNTYPGEITLVALAPLTNIALAIRQDPSFGKKLKAVTIMGGNTEGKGNSHVCAEFNFAADPEAAYVVLNELGAPITLFPWEINLSPAAGQPWKWFDKWVNTDTQVGRFMKAIIQVALHKQRIVRELPVYRSCDLSAIATVIEPGCILTSREVYVTVELTGTYTRGMMVVDWQSRLQKPPNITLIEAIDTARIRPMFENMLK